MNEEHLKPKNIFKPSILSIGYPALQTIKRFCNKRILKIRVKVEEHPLSPPTMFLVTTNFRDTCVLTRVLKNCEEKKSLKREECMHERTSNLILIEF